MIEDRPRSCLLQAGLLLISVGVHGAILMMPLPSAKSPKQSESATVRIMQLPKANRLPALKSSPPLSVKISRSNHQVKSNPTPSNPSHANVPSRTSVPRVIPTDQLTPTQTATPQAGNVFDDFPLYPKAQKGSCGLFQGDQDVASQHTQDAIALVAQYFEQELPMRGYVAKLDPKTAKGQVYQVLKGGSRKFLNLVSCADQGTAIILSDQSLDFSKLQRVAVASQAEAAFDAVLKQLDQFGAERIDVPEFYFAQPEAFFEPSAKDPKSYDMTQPHPGFNGDFVVILDKTPQQLFESFFASNLKTNGFNVAIASAYGGGSVYAVKQSTFVRYLNLVPTQTGTGTIVVVWDRPPS